MDINVILQALPEILTQALGFLLVFIVLKKYAFKAVFDILQNRQEHIAGEIKTAEDERKNLERLKKEYEDRMHAIEQEGRQRIQEAVREGQRVAGEIRKKAQNEAASEIEWAKKDIAREVVKAREIIHRQIVVLSSEMAGKIIKRNVSTDENEKFIEDILKKTKRFS